MARSLAERLRSHEQQKARLAEAEAKLKTAERKQRTRRLIEAGGLVDKAGLLDLEPNALYGALLSLVIRSEDSAQLEEVDRSWWPHLSIERQRRAIRERNRSCSPLLARCPRTPRPRYAKPVSATAR